VWASASVARASFAGTIDEPAGAMLTPWSLRLGLGVDILQRRHVRLLLLSGGGVDVIGVVPVAPAGPGGDVDLGDTQAVLTAAGLLGISIMVPVGTHLCATVLAAGEVAPRLRLQIERGTRTFDVRTLGPWRGTGGAGLAWRW
jgi:hypothetical protein